jgi:hypothetical protein
MRKVFIGGNWKCNNTLPQTQAMITSIVDKLEFDPEKVGNQLLSFRCRSRPHLPSLSHCIVHEKTRARRCGCTKLFNAFFWSLYWISRPRALARY